MLQAEKARLEGRIRLDLTRTDPTGWPERLEVERAALRTLVRDTSIRYNPDPSGVSTARSVLSSLHGGTLGEWILTARTSEAYSIRFQLLADPGEKVAVCRPSYPLLDDLARHGGILLKSIPLRFQGDEWRLDLGWTERLLADPTVRFLALIQPGNPTGWWLNPKERAVVVELCRKHGKAIVCDEVFADDVRGDGFESLQGEDRCLCFVLGGLSKSLGLPHFKLGWIRASGPSEALLEALERLQRLNDSLLSASTPVQMALGDLLSMKEELRKPLEARMTRNLAILDSSSRRGLRWLPSGGGWVRILQLPVGIQEVPFSLELLEKGVLVQPGYFYDLPHENLVVSLLSSPAEVEEGISIINSIIDI